MRHEGQGINIVKKIKKKTYKYNKQDIIVKAIHEY